MGIDWAGYVIVHEDGDAGIITAADPDRISVHFVSGPSWEFAVQDAEQLRSPFVFSPLAAGVANSAVTDGAPVSDRLELLKACCEMVDRGRTTQAIAHWELARCSGWFSRDALNALVAAREHIRDAKLRQQLHGDIKRLLANLHFSEADALYKARCADWWPAAEYTAERAWYEHAGTLTATILHGSLADADAAFARLPPSLLTADEMASILFEKTRMRLARTGIQLDDHQVGACARPERNRLIRARAGSGKSRTLAAFAALAIADEGLAPDQVLTLAFNTQAAREIGDRIRGAAGVPSYRNARTFHSLAYTLVGNKVQQLIGNQTGTSDPSTQQQSLYVERVINEVLRNRKGQRFREDLYQFFRKEIENVERLGSHLQGDEYLAFRRSLLTFSLNGDRVKSNGEKFVADFMFEHCIDYMYERVYSWDATDRLGGTPYRPDFTLLPKSQLTVLEHWAIDPDDPAAMVPSWWQGTSTDEYRQQIDDKRKFWRQRCIPLLETHTGMLDDGREAFEARLKSLLESAGIPCIKRDHADLVEAITSRRPAISRLAQLFVGFISRAKKRGWNVERTRREVDGYADPEPRNRIFHDLAVRAYAEYETLLHADSKWDYDDLLLAAVDAVDRQGAKARIWLDHNRDSVTVADLRWILIDEFQDFSELYHRLVKAIQTANPTVRVVAVGDDWQAINAFAGAQLTFFENFSRYFNESGVATVPTNYRSCRDIVAASNGVMANLGEPALAHNADAGSVEVRNPGYVGNDKCDQLYLDAATDRKSNPGAPYVKFDLAKALKACVDFITNAVYMDGGKRWLPKVLVLSRTHIAYGEKLHEFERMLRHVLEQHAALTDVANYRKISRGDHGDEPLVQVMTAHGAKGKEADTVIILNATDRNFPKLHADNQLFGPFGVTVLDALAEERRLFYVAATRAEHLLLVLTESGKESPYLATLTSIKKGVADNTSSAETVVSQGEFARVVAEQIKAEPAIDRIRRNVSPAAAMELDRMIKTGMGTPAVGHFVGHRCAELAWPLTQPPVAVLTGRNATPENVKAWCNEGWRVIEARS